MAPDRAGKPDPRLRVFGARLRQLREGKHLTLEELAEKAEVGRRQLARVEAGRGSPSLLWLLRVADGLEMTVADMLDADTDRR